ncbi:hypothetical protein BJ165DRAFT_1524814 [Panaeolus papilionaceus]|nr:hypothetical protein BJ165DRAFT_1524814 [Panaeolus papilionaceus]
MSRPPGKNGGSITDGEDEEEVDLNQGGPDNGNDPEHQSDSRPAIAEPVSALPTVLEDSVIRSEGSSAARMPIYGLSSRSPVASGSRKVVEYNRDRVFTPPRPMRKTTRSKISNKRRCILNLKSSSPVESPSSCSSGFSWSPVSTSSTSTVRPLQVQPSGSSVPVNLTVSSVHQFAPRSEFLSRIPSPSGLTHNDAYQQAQILAARRLDLEIELRQTEELLNRMTKKVGKGKAKEE